MNVHLVNGKNLSHFLSILYYFWEWQWQILFRDSMETWLLSIPFPLVQLPEAGDVTWRICACAPL